MSPVLHTAISGVATAFFSKYTTSMWALISCFLSGIFIDLDHVLDYFIAKRKIPLSYQELRTFCGYDKMGKSYLIFHSYELIGSLWLAIFVFDLGPAWLGLAIGVSVHMFFDELANPLRPMAYFFYFRYKRGFAKEKLFTEKHYKTHVLKQ